MFDEDWNKKNKTYREEEFQIQDNLSIDPQTVVFDDVLILSVVSRYRNNGYRAYILSQPANLPSGYTREDILIEKLK